MYSTYLRLVQNSDHRHVADSNEAVQNKILHRPCIPQ